MAGGSRWRRALLVLVCFAGAAVAARAQTNPVPVQRLVLDPKKLAASGEFAAGTNWQVISFQTPAKGRYFCFDALSSLDDKPFAAIAELELLDVTGKLLDHEDWRIAYADSEERDRENGGATNAIDGNPATFWHTQWSELPTAYPHRIIVDLGHSVTLTGFRYLPRQGEENAAGHIKGFQITVGENLKLEAPPTELLPPKVFLFSYFTDHDREGLHLAWSKDGYQWDPLNNGLSIYSPAIGGTNNNLFRDPCILQGPDGIFRVVWTCEWTGQNIGYSESKDLIHWSEGKTLPVMKDEPNTVNCWAPEIYWDDRRSEYFLIWAKS